MTIHNLKLHNGVLVFWGDIESKDVYDETVLMAENCPDFQMDVEDEIVYEGQMTCCNCRFRRWHPEGFTCYKKFPKFI
ncbi:hypothetical protein [Neobacillus muris]|uniref:hypothetical protein n=1 Tax=Neobacillus muris TaxID=2941334 RepID=UPI00203CE729|nr:hypothetical protein [Neobacillus muris]